MTLGPTSRRLDVAVAVVVVPRRFVGIVGIVRDEPLEDLGHVVLYQAATHIPSW